VWKCGAETGFDSGDPRSRRKIASTISTAVERNSLCQFWKLSNQNSADAKWARMVTEEPPCRLFSLLASRALLTRCRTKETRKSDKRAAPREWEYSVRPRAPVRTGQGVSGLSASSAGSRSWGAAPCAALDSGEPF